MNLCKCINIVKIIIPWLGTAFAIHQWFYNKSPKYYFLIKKLLQSWKDTKWNITVSFTIDRDEEIFKKIEKTIGDVFEKNRRTFNLKNRKQYEFGDFSMVVQYDLDCSQGDIVQLELMFRNMNVTYKNSRQRLKELRVLFGELEKKIPIKNKQYCMDIYFTDLTNPFYGLMIQRLGDDKVKEFECVFPVEALELSKKKNTVSDKYLLRVFKNKITINEEEFYRVEEIALRCLLVG